MGSIQVSINYEGFCSEVTRPIIPEGDFVISTNQVDVAARAALEALMEAMVASGYVDLLDEDVPQPDEVPAQPAVTVGREVHFYTRDDSDPIAAKVTAVNPHGTVSLVLFYPNGSGVMREWDVPFSETPAKDHWSWPPRV